MSELIRSAEGRVASASAANGAIAGNIIAVIISDHTPTNAANERPIERCLRPGKITGRSLQEAPGSGAGGQGPGPAERA